MLTISGCCFVVCLWLFVCFDCLLLYSLFLWLIDSVVCNVVVMRCLLGFDCCADVYLLTCALFGLLD